LKPKKLQIIAVVVGQTEIKSPPGNVNLSAGQFCLVPADSEQTEIVSKADATLLRVEAN